MGRSIQQWLQTKKQTPFVSSFADRSIKKSKNEGSLLFKGSKIPQIRPSHHLRHFFVSRQSRFRTERLFSRGNNKNERKSDIWNKNKGNGVSEPMIAKKKNQVVETKESPVHACIHSLPPLVGAALCVVLLSRS
jgi:hypothetical protein